MEQRWLGQHARLRLGRGRNGIRRLLPTKCLATAKRRDSRSYLLGVVYASISCVNDLLGAPS